MERTHNFVLSLKTIKPPDWLVMQELQISSRALSPSLAINLNQRVYTRATRASGSRGREAASASRDKKHGLIGARLGRGASSRIEHRPRGPLESNRGVGSIHPRAGIVTTRAGAALALALTAGAMSAGHVAFRRPDEAQLATAIAQVSGRLVGSLARSSAPFRGYIISAPLLLLSPGPALRSGARFATAPPPREGITRAAPSSLDFGRPAAAAAVAAIYSSPRY